MTSYKQAEANATLKHNKEHDGLAMRCLLFKHNSKGARRMLAKSRHVRGLALKRLVVEHLWLAPVLHIVECRGPAKGGDAILQATRR